MINIGVLALQGSFKEHYNSLKALDKNLKVNPSLVKTPDDLAKVKLLIIPGGESTTICKLLIKSGLFDLINNRINKDLSVWGTCAGAILLAKKVLRATSDQKFFNAVDITIERNAYGSALDSFEEELFVNEIDRKIPAVFIRAPKIIQLSDSVTVLSKINNTNIVAAYQNKCLVTTFHPELTSDLSMHEYFVKNFS